MSTGRSLYYYDNGIRRSLVYLERFGLPLDAKNLALYATNHQGSGTVLTVTLTGPLADVVEE
jgi:hypothetical protein